MHIIKVKRIAIFPPLTFTHALWLQLARIKEFEFVRERERDIFSSYLNNVITIRDNLFSQIVSQNVIYNNTSMHLGDESRGMNERKREREMLSKNFLFFAKNLKIFALDGTDEF